MRLFHNNLLFRRCQIRREHIVEHAEPCTADREDIESYGMNAGGAGVDRRCVEHTSRRSSPVASATDYLPCAERRMTIRALCRTRTPASRSLRIRETCPCAAPGARLLWFIATYAPEMESWERDILWPWREESFYFYPVTHES